jgi:capsular exopolysaccharide synthesis family protein
MKFFDKALKQAQAQRPRIGPLVSPIEVKTGINSLPEEGEPTGSPKPVQEICYTHTRKVPVDVNTLVRHRLIAGGADPLVVQAYKLLRTHILQKTFTEGHNTLMVVSPRPDEGKTLTAVNLAISMAQELDKTALLVDADLRAPAIHKYFGLPVGPGLIDYLEGSKTIPELLVHPQGLDKLVLLPGGRPTEWAAELIRSGRMVELVKEVKNFYPDRYILFDLAPMLSYADALAFAPLVDGIIVVVEARQTPREDLMRMREMLAGYPVLGYVFNKADFLDGTSYYGKNYGSNGNPRKGWGRWFKGRRGQ